MNIKYIYMIIGIIATGSIITIAVSSSEQSLDQILANRDCEALEKYGQTKIYDTNVTPEQSKKIFEVAGYCAGKALKNLSGNDPKTTTSELKPSAILEPAPTVVPINKELQEFQKLIDSYPTLQSILEKSKINKQESRELFDELMAKKWTKVYEDTRENCKEPYFISGEATMLACYDYIRWNISPGSMFSSPIKYYNAIDEWVMSDNELRSEIKEKYFDKADKIDDPIKRTDLKTSIENCDKKLKWHSRGLPAEPPIEMAKCLINLKIP